MSELADPAAIQQLLTSLSLAIGSGLIAVSFGLPLAVMLSRLHIAGGRIAWAIIAALLFAPLYVHLAGWDAVGAWLGLFGRNAPQAVLSGLPIAIWVHGVAAVPWAVVLITVGLTQVPRSEEEQALLELPLTAVLWQIIVPRAMPWIVTAGFFAAVSSWYEMTVTNVYLVPTVTEGVYNRIAGNFVNESIYPFPAYAVCAGLIVMAAYSTRVLLLGDYRQLEQSPIRWSVNRTQIISSAIVWLMLVLLAGVPLLVLVRQAGLSTRIVGSEALREWSLQSLGSTLWRTLLVTRMDFWWTFVAGASAATLSLMLAVPVAWWARGENWRYALVFLVAFFLLAIPGPFIGLAIIKLLNQPALPALAFLYDRTVFAPALAQAIRALPLVLLVVWHAVAQFDRSQLEAAQLDGCGPWEILWRIVLPQRLLALLVAWLLGLTIAIGDVSCSLLVIPAGKDLIQRRLFGMIHSGVDNQVAAACLLILLVAGFAGAASAKFRVQV
ncbi:spermidine/putrescine ABC transporter membrane protein [Anatilimnocola aggregata]|uniref:Spermidine/putrescine ABC transporter membrane protein n=1 Tax=Anatilimnocola aggregata TaxID=2528021 RepID=A0A517YL92_9BACT|nr:ABC transporter permease subunit [Anatilimnocola aggregata]QDU30996.1 spermidine/putrescine ABC transporter membrane protein [Anatilimnocola aggregata]